MGHKKRDGWRGSNEAQFFDELIKKVGDLKLYSERDVTKFINLIKPNSEDIILDIGCGTGYIGAQARKGTWIGVDISKNMLRIAMQRLLFVVNADARFLPFRNECINKVVCIALLHHEPRELLNILQQVKRVLKNGGSLHVIEPSAKNAKVFLYHHPKSPLRGFCTKKEIALFPEEVETAVKKIGLKLLSSHEINVSYKGVERRLRRPLLRFLITTACVNVIRILVEKLLLRVLKFDFKRESYANYFYIHASKVKGGC